ncbi:MAG: hypothetical protein L6Q40_10415 [Azonexus sp.]|nr:hypothetical protein [Azonexus sp.]
MKQAHSQQGFMLLESLIAILIFSFGVLGMVAINARSVQALSDAEYRSEASRLADEIASQIALGVTRGANRTVDAGSLAGFAYSGTASAADPATNAVQAILKNKVTTLPGAGALPQRVEVLGGFNEVRITLRWSAPSDQGNTRSHVLTTYIN